MRSPIYKFASRYLTMHDKDAWRNEDGYLTGIEWMAAGIAWDKAHPVRYRLWRIYIGMTTSPRTRYRLYVRRPICRFIQRGRRGWSDQDVWSFDTFLARVISEGCTHLRGVHSYPGDITEEEWDAILEKIASGFGDYVMGRFEWLEDDPGYARFNESMELLVKWWGNLWD